MSATGGTVLRIEHTTRYDYAATVRASFNEARLTPLDEPGQRVLEHRVEISPQTWRSSYQDYWGTQVVAFEVMTAHDQLTVVGTSIVDVNAAGRPLDLRDGPGSEVTWDQLRGLEVTDRWCEFLASSPVTAPPGDLVDAASRAAAARPPLAAALHTVEAVRDRMTYQPGSTGVHTSAGQAWAEGRGVCQDFAHLTVGALRAIGIPARYVSGYLHPAPDSPIGTTVSGESHAWVEFWLNGWVGFDPTNDAPPGRDHVVVGRGREYADVRPVHGLVSKGAAGQLAVSVQLTRLS